MVEELILGGPHFITSAASVASTADMASSHGVPRVAKEGDGEKERNDIHDYRALLNQVSAKVRAQSLPPQL